MSDLISREALKKQFKELHLHPDLIDLIDNAPSVEPEKALIANVTFDEDKLKEIVQTEVIDKIKSGELVLKDENPQGEWTIGYTAKQKKVAVCNLCNRISFQGKTNFCHNCGAKMKKGGAE